ncbi:CDP-alcohol phosphatidyltransferase family protein [Portibacter marinus]|uniref:CDP-alcohol phosphatidyltransferase family protein n=1 Tax=Portibacter marinus TaxID=2898660 RepID=UPI001F34475A|nr:CDP-alcohol phosphatidyltransferase family protein [Portibacter marinus]
MSQAKNKFQSIALAWLVHLFTATGIVFGFLAILATNEADFRTAMFYLIVAAVIDGVDGTLARRFRVKEVLPKINGSMIDTVVDFTNYAVVPTYMIYKAGILPESLGLYLAALILLTSASYYGKEGMVYEEKYFIGFPVLWNVVAFFCIFVFSDYLILNAILIVVLSILHFVPLKFPYPSRPSRYQKLDLAISALLMGTMLTVIYFWPVEYVFLSWLAVVCGFYFLGMAVWNTAREA